MRRLIYLILLTAIIVGPLSACGRIGPPEPPKDAKNVYPRPYPSNGN